MSDSDWVFLICWALLGIAWSMSVAPVSDPVLSHDWEAEAAEFSTRIRPGDHWGR